MMKPYEWTVALKKERPWQERYATVALEAKAVLENIAPEDAISTTELMDRLFPKNLAVGDGITARNMLGDILLKLSANSLKEYVTLGTPRRWYGHIVYPRLWHKHVADKELGEIDAAIRILISRYGREKVLLVFKRIENENPKAIERILNDPEQSGTENPSNPVREMTEKKDEGSEPKGDEGFAGNS